MIHTKINIAVSCALLMILTSCGKQAEKPVEAKPAKKTTTASKTIQELAELPESYVFLDEEQDDLFA